MSARSVASSSPFSATCSTNVKNSSILRRLSAAFSSPTIRVVRRSETKRITSRSGVIRRTQTLIGAATTAVLNRTGFETAIVFGVISPNSSTSGTIKMILNHPARCSPYRLTRIPAALIVAAMLISSLPVRIEMINRRG